MRILIVTALIGLTSCASYVKGLHRQIDRDEDRQGGVSKVNDPYAAYREQGFKRTRGDKKPIQNPYSLSHLNPTADVPPPIKRNYRPAGVRASAQDFTDDGSSGSLWVNAPGGSLFTTEISKRVGDILIVNVLTGLRDQISGELKRAFPEKKNAKKKDAGPSPAAAAPTGPAADKGDELESKVHDKISSVVAEEINKDYFLVRGKKEVIFRKEKRLIEVQALVARKDIAENDTISSDRLVESRVIILR